jgi:hypothetical protein
VCDRRDLYAEVYRTKMSHPGGERKAWPIRSWRRSIAAGFRGGRSRSVKSHYITYEKPQYTIKVMVNFI